MPKIFYIILKALSVKNLQPRARIASVLLQNKKWLGTALSFGCTLSNQSAWTRSVILHFG
jgi:hypothetical protein